MKKVFYINLVLAIGILSGCSLPRAGEKASEITLSYWDEKAPGKEAAGYDTKFRVSIDGSPAGESDVADRYARKNLRVNVNPGTHVVIIEGLARKNGIWEERTKRTGYSLDHRLIKELTVGPGEKKVINFVVPDKAKLMWIRL